MTTTQTPTGQQTSVIMVAGPGVQISSVYNLPDGSSIKPNSSGQLVVPDVRFVAALQNAGLVTASTGNT